MTVSSHLSATLRQPVSNSWAQWVVAAFFCSLAFPASALELVTATEAAHSMQHEAAHPDLGIAAKAFDPMAPRILLVAPDLSGGQDVKSPLTIRLKFQPASGADIVPDSFRARYGAFRIDITERLLKATKVTREGIEVDRAELPSGSHRLFLSVQDNGERTGEQEIRFSVQ